VNAGGAPDRVAATRVEFPGAFHCAATAALAVAEEALKG